MHNCLTSIRNLTSPASSFLWMVLIALATVPTSFLAIPCAAQETEAQQRDWIDEVRKLIDQIPNGSEAEYRNFYEAKARLGVVSANRSHLEVAQELMQELSELETPKSMPWNVGIDAIAMAIVKSHLENQQPALALSFVGELPFKPGHLSMFYEVAEYAVQHDSGSTLEKVMNRINELRAEEKITQGSTNRFGHLVLVAQAIHESASGNTINGLELFREALIIPAGTQMPGWSKSTDESWQPYGKSKEDVVILMATHGFGEEAVEAYRQYRDQLEKPERYSIPLGLVRALAKNQQFPLAREICELNSDAHRKAYAFCELAEHSAEESNLMESDIDLSRCIAILRDTGTQPSKSLKYKLAAVYRMHDEQDLADQYAEQSLAQAKDHSAGKRVIIEDMLKNNIEPEWRDSMLPNRRNTSNFSLLVKIAKWYYDQGDQKTARFICEKLEEVGMDYSKGAGIGSDGMRSMRSDIWAQLMTARAWAVTGDFDRSLEILTGVSDYHCCEGMRIIAGFRAGEDDHLLENWFLSIERIDLKAFAMLGVLEERDRLLASSM